MQTILRGLTLVAVVALGSLRAVGQDPSLTMPPPGGFAPAMGQPGTGPGPRPSSDGLAWPPPGGRPNSGYPVSQGSPPRDYGPGRLEPIVPAETTALASVGPLQSPADRLVESTWYFRQDAFYWNERSDGVDFVNEAGPLSTLGYLHRYGQERFRLELFGGSVSYDGGAQFDDGWVEPYHESFGTNYLGLRGEYDLLVEPDAWTRMRLLLGIGTRFWIRDLRDAYTPSGFPVAGYQETWWTFYPYIGLESKDSNEAGLQMFGSVRLGVTPLTYQHATYFDTALYPRCGLTGRAELGVHYRALYVSAVVEAMTWGESADVRGSFQPESRMLTLGGQMGYRF